MAVHNNGGGGWSLWNLCCCCCGEVQEDQKVTESSRLLHDGLPKDQRDMHRRDAIMPPSTYQPPPLVHEDRKDEEEGRRTPPMDMQGSPPGSPGTLSAPGTPDSAYGVQVHTGNLVNASSAKKTGENEGGE